MWQKCGRNVALAELSKRCERYKNKSNKTILWQKCDRNMAEMWQTCGRNVPDM